MKNTMIPRLKRLWQSAIFAVMPLKQKSMYAYKHKLFAYYGNMTGYQPKVIPLYPELIKLHENVGIGRNVEFVTHDYASVVLNNLPGSKGDFGEVVGCIEVMDNVFIGNGAIIMYGVRIGENSVIAAGSVVTKSTEPNSIYAGIPAKRIGSIKDLEARRADPNAPGPIMRVTHHLNLTEEEVSEAWRRFDEFNSR